MSKHRKKVFPKKPIPLTLSQLEKQINRWSNKNGYEASVKGIYQSKKRDDGPTDQQIINQESLRNHLNFAKLWKK